MRTQKGFTLVEVLITMAIISVISILAAQTIQRGFQAKVKIQNQIDDLSRVRDALRLMERDLALAFHYRDIEKEIDDTVKRKNSPTQQIPQPGSGGFFPPPSPAAQQQEPQEEREAPRLDPTTHFVGSGEAMNFVTMNNSRIQANLRQADHIEVGYSIKACKQAQGGSGNCLWRRSSPVVDSDVTRGGDELVLLENVTELKFRYIGKGKQDWVSEWRTDSGGDAVTKGNYPAGVEISLTYSKGEGDSAKKYSMQIVAPIHFPNNKEEDSRNGNPTANQPPTQ